MTGYGSFVVETENLKVSTEVKSLNSKFLDLNLRLPKEYADKEVELRNLTSTLLERGKVSIVLEIEEKGESRPSVTINRKLVQQYYQDLKETADLLGTTQCDLMRVALTLPKAINTESVQKDTTQDWDIIFEAVKNSLLNCDAFRKQEGALLGAKLKEYITKIEAALEIVIQHDPQRIAAVREKIKNHFEEFKLTEAIDQNRFEQELIYYIEKLDISEEKVRLKSHLDYFLDTMNSKEGTGKKLGFIAQEIGREINTIGSKANDAKIQRQVIDMKEELEKIKEQSLNIL